MKIAIVKLSALGDIVHAMIVLQFIKNHSQKVKVDWIVDESFRELLDFHPDINIVHTLNIKKVKEKKSIYLLIKELRKVRKFGQYDLVIDMQGLVKSALISRLIISSATIGFDRSSIRESIAAIFYHKTFKYGYDENVIYRNFELIKFALDLPFKNKEIHYKLPLLFPSHKHEFSSLSNIKKNIILIPGASDKSKCYPVDKFAKVIRSIDENFLIIWGNENEKNMANQIKVLSEKAYICEKLSINKLIALISQVDLVIGADTGPTHMAWALNIPSITLFGSTPSYRNTLSTNINKSIESKSKVNPNKIDKSDYSISEISTDKISLLANELLRKRI